MGAWLICLFVFLFIRNARLLSERIFDTYSADDYQPYYERCVNIKPSIPEEIKKDLVVLGLERMPDSLADLKKAYWTKMREVHPDLGGTEEDAVKAGVAMEKLKGMF